MLQCPKSPKGKEEMHGNPFMISGENVFAREKKHCWFESIRHGAAARWVLAGANGGVGVLGFWRRSLKLLPELAARGSVTRAPVADLTSGPLDPRFLLVCDVAAEATVQLLYPRCLGKVAWCWCWSSMAAPRRPCDLPPIWPLSSYLDCPLSPVAISNSDKDVRFRFSNATFGDGAKGSCGLRVSLVLSVTPDSVAHIPIPGRPLGCSR
ncbi:Uncharacterized protein Rs2_03644 [Raphanus sativus]|nr:Uncharacterized protein Rs2_03644 [Raphanus sativus]